MAIRSKFNLASTLAGKGWTADLLPKVGTRAGMSCIYKIRMDGDTKRAGLYLSHRQGDVVYMDVAGNKFVIDLVKNEIKYQASRSSKYSDLVNDAAFMDMVNLTLAHFNCVEDPSGVYNPPPPKVIALTDDEAAGIAAFGFF